jgi:stress response protein SCP2
MDRLQKHFASTKVSKRLLMFHVLFLQLVEKQTMDFLFGRPPAHVRQIFKAGIQRILAVETWPGFFSALKRPCPNPSALTDIIKQAVKNSRQKKYHTDKTDFSRIQASGTSHILKKGESYNVSQSVRKLHLELGSDSAMILCGACLAYEDLTCSRVVCFTDRTAYKGALKHSGDQQIDGKSKHIMDVDLARLPPSVNRLFFTLCACGADNLSAFKNPAIALQDAEGTPLCSYTIDQAGRAPTVVMAGVERREGSWRVTALGKHSAVRCCGDYSQVKRDIATIKL